MAQKNLLHTEADYTHRPCFFPNNRLKLSTQKSGESVLLYHFLPVTVYIIPFTCRESAMVNPVLTIIFSMPLRFVV